MHTLHNCMKGKQLLKVAYFTRYLINTYNSVGNEDCNSFCVFSHVFQLVLTIDKIKACR